MDFSMGTKAVPYMIPTPGKDSISITDDSGDLDSTDAAFHEVYGEGGGDLSSVHKLPSGHTESPNKGSSNKYQEGCN